MTEKSVPTAGLTVGRQEYYLVCGEIIFRTSKDSEEAPNALRLNTVLTSVEGKISVAHLGRAQQALQLHFFQKMGDPNLAVIDVVIITLTSLGWFTPEEFNKAPEGMQLVERGDQLGEVAGNA